MPKQGNRPRVEVHKPRVEPKVKTVANTLHNHFGYGKMDARQLAKDILSNLDNYLTVIEVVGKRVPYTTAVRPTQTAWRQAHAKL
jgi:hypothetical protein